MTIVGDPFTNDVNVLVCGRRVVEVGGLDDVFDVVVLPGPELLEELPGFGLELEGVGP